MLMGGRAALLLTASCMCSKARAHKPASALAGFMRFLHVLSQHEWQAYPLLCDPANSLRDEEIKEALKGHRALLPTSSAPACCLITPYDLEGSTWTKEGPAAVIVTRMRRLAATSLDCMTRAIVRAGQWRDADAECDPHLILGIYRHEMFAKRALQEPVCYTMQTLHSQIVSRAGLTDLKETTGRESSSVHHQLYLHA